MSAPPYVPLWVKSSHSFLEGASHPEDLVDRAHAHRLPAMALTDRDGLYGAVKAFSRAKELAESAPPRPLVGAELTLTERAEPTPTEVEGAWDTASLGTGPRAMRAWRAKGEPPRHGHARSRVVLLAEDRDGYGRLTRLLTLGHARATEKGAARVSLDEVRDAHGGLVALAPTPEVLMALHESHRGRLYALVARHLTPEDVENERELRREARRLGVPTVASVEVLYHDRTRQPLQDVLSCVRFHRTIETAGRLLRPNAEHELLSRESFAQRFADDPESVARTLEVAERAAFGLGQLRYRYPAERVPLGQTEKSWLRSLTEAGACARYHVSGYGEVPADVRAQIEKELALIEELDYGGYFLTMWDVVRFCEEKKILCQGRGSAANSVVCFCLRITAVDPVRMDLLFERFLSRERAEPPDIDLDIEHERREEVIQYVYERWGRRRAAMVANLIRYRLKSALRDVGKVLGLPELALDRAAKILSRRDDVDETVIREAGLDPEAPVTKHLLVLTAQIQDFPRHLGIHPGGFLLGHEPVDTLCPVEKATMPGRTVVQWDKQDVEDLGLFKIDLLGLGCLTVVKKAFQTLREKDEIRLDVATVPAEDVATYAMVSRGDTVGVFQIESRAQMAMLPRLAPRTFYDLVIEVAIVRPGPIQGDMVHPYLRRRAGKEAVEFPHPKLERVLQKTLGVPIFQEQVMKLAVLCAGYTPGEADQLRRDMAAWRSKGRIERHREKLVSRMVEDGVPLEFAERVFSQIEGFGEYGFPESHAASFALLAYVTAWLRCHHPAHFACALLNSWPMGFYHPSTIVDDVKRHGVTVLPIDVTKSGWDCTLEPVAKRGWGIRMGLRYVRGLGERERLAIEAAGERPFGSLVDFVRRTRLSRAALEHLAEADAFVSLGETERRGKGETGLPRRSALWDIRKLADERKDELDLSTARTSTRFPGLGSAESIAWDYRASLHSTRGHPMEELRAWLDDDGVRDARSIAAMRNGERVRAAGLVICRQRPGTATGVTFLTLEDETGFANVVVWRDVFDRFEVVGKTATLLEVTGKIQSEDGVVHVIAERLADLSERVKAAAGEVEKSRDFH